MFPGTFPNVPDTEDRVDYRALPVLGIDEMARTPEQKYQIIAKWKIGGGILLLGYETFRILVSKRQKVQNPYERENDINEALLDPGPQLVICDEGHRIKNENAQVFINRLFRYVEIIHNYRLRKH